MNSSALAQSAYSQAGSIAPTHRDTEYRAFARVTRDIASHSPDDPTAFPRLVEALHLNQRLWSLLAEDVADTANALPDALRAQIFYLAEFTRGHTSQILDGKAAPDVLVDINTAIMRGLRAAAEDGADAVALAPTTAQGVAP